MEQVLVVFSSATSAAGVKKYLLKKYNIQSKMRQVPGSISSNGCSYGLAVKATDAETVKKVAKENSITVKGVYKEDGPRL